MFDNGFKPLESEWWHFTLKDEPYPDTYFTFPVNECVRWCSCTVPLDASGGIFRSFAPDFILY